MESINDRVKLNLGVQDVPHRKASEGKSLEDLFCFSRVAKYSREAPRMRTCLAPKARPSQSEICMTKDHDRSGSSILAIMWAWTKVEETELTTFRRAGPPLVPGRRPNG